MGDAALKERIFSNKAKKKKYQQVRNDIMNNNLSSQQSLSDTNDLIDKCKDYISKIDGNDGYGYLSNFRTKLSDEKKVLKKYRDFVRDSNKAFVQMYSDLGDEISALESSINSDVKTYNKGKPWGKQIHWWDLL